MEAHCRHLRYISSTRRDYLGKEMQILSRIIFLFISRLRGGEYVEFHDLYMRVFLW